MPSSACSGRSPTTSARSRPGRAQYTHLLDEANGSVLDDIIVWWIDDETFDVMPNASNTDRVRNAIGGPGDHPRQGGARGAGPVRSRVALRRVRRGGRREALRCDRVPTGTASRASSPAPATRARTASRSRCRPTRPPTCGRPSSAPASCPPASAPATRCGSKPRCRCTATSSAPASRRCRPAWVGSSAGPRATSAAVPRSRSNRPAASIACLRGIATEGRRPPREGCAGTRRRRAGWRRHQRQLLARARPRHRARVPAARGRRRRRGRGRRPRLHARRRGRPHPVRLQEEVAPPRRFAPLSLPAAPCGCLLWKAVAMATGSLGTLQGSRPMSRGPSTPNPPTSPGVLDLGGYRVGRPRRIHQPHGADFLPLLFLGAGLDAGFGLGLALAAGLAVGLAGGGAGGGGGGAAAAGGRPLPPRSTFERPQPEQAAGVLGHLGQRLHPAGEVAERVEEGADVGRHRGEHRRGQRVGRAG